MMILRDAQRFPAVPDNLISNFTVNFTYYFTYYHYFYIK